MDTCVLYIFSFMARQLSITVRGTMVGSYCIRFTILLLFFFTSDVFEEQKFLGYPAVFLVNFSKVV